MGEKRKFERRHLIYYLKVFSMDSEKLVGNLANINQGGLMLINENPIKPMTIIQLKIVLPSEINQMESLEVYALSKWSNKDFNPDFYKIGFQFSGLKKKGTSVIDRLIRAYGFQH